MKYEKAYRQLLFCAKKLLFCHNNILCSIPLHKFVGKELFMKSNTIDNLRSSAVIDAFFDTVKKIRSTNPYISQKKVLEYAAKTQAPRFYTTFENARRFVSLLERGKKLPITNPYKLEMYKELHRRYKEAKTEDLCPAYAILEKIIEEPAPSFYISPYTISKIIYKNLKRK